MSKIITSVSGILVHVTIPKKGANFRGAAFGGCRQKFWLVNGTSREQENQTTGPRILKESS